jgi:predicted Zn-dependent protease
MRGRLFFPFESRLAKGEDRASALMSDQQRQAVMVLAHLYLENGKATEALSLLQALHLLFPQDGEILCLLAWALLLNGDPATAVRAIDEALASGSTNETQYRAALMLKSKALWQTSQPIEARAAVTAWERLPLR